VILGVVTFLLLFAGVYLKTECTTKPDGRFGLFKQEVLAEDKLIRE